MRRKLTGEGVSTAINVDDFDSKTTYVTDNKSTWCWSSAPPPSDEHVISVSLTICEMFS
jgi:hypothetical protein